MRTVFLVLTLILTLGLGVAAAQSADEAAVNTRVEEAYAALNRSDVEGYAAAFHEDAVHAIATNVSVGRANIATFVGPLFASGLRITFTRHATRLLSPTTALVYGAQEVPGAPGVAHAMLTLVKEGNEWFIAAIQVAGAF